MQVSIHHPIISKTEKDFSETSCFYEALSAKIQYITSHSRYFFSLTERRKQHETFYWIIYKSKRLKILVFGSKTFADAFNMSYLIKHKLQIITKIDSLLTIMSKILLLYDSLTGATWTPEKKHIIDLMTVNDRQQWIITDLRSKMLYSLRLNTIFQTHEQNLRRILVHGGFYWVISCLIL